MSLKSKHLGNWGEDYSSTYLCKKGYKILCRNYRIPLVEIDIIALYKDTLVGVEVKTRSSSLYGHPEDYVSARKWGNIMWGLHAYALEQHVNYTYTQIDILSLLKSKAGKDVPTIRHFKNIHF